MPLNFNLRASIFKIFLGGMPDPLALIVLCTITSCNSQSPTIATPCTKGPTCIACPRPVANSYLCTCLLNIAVYGLI